MGTTIPQIVDDLGELQAQIAKLKKQAKRLQRILIAHGDGAYAGERYDATVSSTERETLDMAAVRAKLSPQFIRAHTNSTPVTSVRVVARVAERKKAA